MDKIEKYRRVLLYELEKIAGRVPSNMPDVNRQIVIDGERNQFVLFSVGWHHTRYIHQCLIHAQTKESKIWIHHDLTDPGLMERLAENGVLEEDMVLAFVPEHERVGQEAFFQ